MMRWKEEKEKEKWRGKVMAFIDEEASQLFKNLQQDQDVPMREENTIWSDQKSIDLNRSESISIFLFRHISEDT